MGRRSVCDPFDAAAIVERIATGETTAADAYRRYAASAARPCARATFAGALSRARGRAGRPDRRQRHAQSQARRERP